MSDAPANPCPRCGAPPGEEPSAPAERRRAALAALQRAQALLVGDPGAQGLLYDVARLVADLEGRVGFADGVPPGWESLPPTYLALLKDERLDFVPVREKPGTHGWVQHFVPPGVSAAIRRYLFDANRADRPPLEAYVRAALPG